MSRFKNYCYDQLQLIPVSFKHQILPGSFEHALSYLIYHELDTSIFHTSFKNDDNGRPAYDPALLLKWSLDLDSFSLRGKTKVNGQWKLMATRHNLLKLQKYGTVG